MRLVERVQHSTEPFVALPVRRVYIPKRGSSTKRRPLGIPVIADRAHQARVVNALEPEWEARFEPRSYGFRPGRGCHDAIGAVYRTVRGASPLRRWILDADLAGAFDRIAHQHILNQIGSFPAREMIGQWLKAGVVEQGRLHRTEEGTPQGGVVSPVLLNVALHGMEQAAGVRYYQTGRAAGWTVVSSPVLIRYADDLVALCHSKHEAEQVKARLATWLAPRGLCLNEDKTRVVCLDDGFDFLGFNVRRQSGKLLIKPSTAAQRRIRERLRTEMRSLRGANARAVIKRLNPRLGRLLPASGLQRGVLSAGRPSVEARLQMGALLPPEQAAVLGHSQVLRQVQSVQERPVGVRRPRQRDLPPQVRLDQDRPTPNGQRRGVPGRPRPVRLLGQPTEQGTTPVDRHDQPAALRGPARPLPGLRGLAALRPRPATEPTRVGTLAARRPQDDHHDRPASGRHAGRHQTPSRTRPLPQPAAQGSGSSTSARP